MFGCQAIALYHNLQQAIHKQFAHSSAQCSLERLTEDWKRALGVGEEEDLALRELESAVGLYLRRVCSSHNITDIIQETKSLLYDKYSSHPPYASISQLEQFISYVVACSQLAWDLCIQSPPMVISDAETEFSPDMHLHFHNSDKTSLEIVLHLWPTLLQVSGPTLVRGYVLT